MLADLQGTSSTTTWGDCGRPPRCYEIVRLKLRLDISQPDAVVGNEERGQTRLIQARKVETTQGGDGRLVAGARTAQQPMIANPLRGYDAQTTSGGSGGPLFNRKGKVIGINYAVVRDFGGSNFGVPARYAQEFLLGLTSR